MTQQTVNIGANPNDGTGDTLRDAFLKVNMNFDEVYSMGVAGPTGATGATGTNGIDGATGATGATGAGYVNVPQNSQNTNYFTVLTDSGKHILHPTSDANSRTFTVDTANVTYDIGTTITFVNQSNAGSLNIAISSGTMRLAGAGTTGTRVLAANGIATVIKLDSTDWLINGTNLT